MFKSIARAIERFFAPAFELLSQLPPGAIARLGSPF